MQGGCSLAGCYSHLHPATAQPHHELGWRAPQQPLPMESPSVSLLSFFVCLFPSVVLLPQSWKYHQFFLRPIKSDFCIPADRPNTECTPFLSHEGFISSSTGDLFLLALHKGLLCLQPCILTCPFSLHAAILCSSSIFCLLLFLDL